MDIVLSLDPIEISRVISSEKQNVTDKNTAVIIEKLKEGYKEAFECANQFCLDNIEIDPGLYITTTAENSNYELNITELQREWFNYYERSFIIPRPTFWASDLFEFIGGKYNLNIPDARDIRKKILKGIRLKKDKTYVYSKN